jgi:hypothetical protein
VLEHAVLLLASPRPLRPLPGGRPGRPVDRPGAGW